MPQVISYTPEWLSRPHPGFQLFNPGPQGTKSFADNYKSDVYYDGPHRTIARRGSEVFVVVGKHIRWADLPALKDQYSSQQQTPSSKPRKKTDNDQDPRHEDTIPDDGSYRILKVPISEPIRQLRISPGQDMMAIITSHTVHIAILPIPDLLNASFNETPLKLRTYTIGPTTHVLSQASIADALWHPLGHDGHCLLTITIDGIVRLWEFDANNRWSADSPTLALDLRKLALAQSEEDDVAPNESNRNRGFSTDAVGMDVASACFGGQGFPDEDPWSALTLWIAMTSGDVYALCPLLPSRFQSGYDLISDLSVAIIEGKASLADDGAHAELEAVDDQLGWIRELDSQEPEVKAQSNDGSGQGFEVWKRPSNVSAVPRLQGPFQLLPEESENLELSDIHLIAGKRRQGNDDFLPSTGPSDEVTDKALSASLVCLLTRLGRVYICLDLEGIEGQWLARKNPLKPHTPRPEPCLIVLEALETISGRQDSDDEWPTFTPDIESSRYSFFTTHSHAVYHFSLLTWLDKLEKEFQNPDSAGAQFRINMLRDQINTTRNRIFTFTPPIDTSTTPSVPACLVFVDSDLGYFLLTTFDSQPQAATLGRPYAQPTKSTTNLASTAPTDPPPNSSQPLLAKHYAYAPYQPSAAFYQPSALPNFINTHVSARHKPLFKNEIRLSTATLDIFTEAHRVLSRETHQLGTAAADLFRRCEKMLELLRNQILTVGEVAEKVEKVVAGDDTGEGQNEGVNAKMERRIENARARSQHLKERYEGLRRKLRGLENRELSLRERDWVREIEGLGDTVIGKHISSHSPRTQEDYDGSDEDAEHDDDADTAPVPPENGEGEVDETSAQHLNRFKEIQRLSQDLLQQAKDLASSSPPEGSSTQEKSPPPPSSTPPTPSKGESSPSRHERASSVVSSRHQSPVPIPAALKQKKTAHVMRMLERETALIEETQRRLEDLTLRIRA